MPLRTLQDIIIAYAQHLYAEGRFRALDSSIEYPYNGPAFAFRQNGERLELVDNTQELLRLPDGEEIMAPVNHRDFREPKSNQVRAAFLKFRYWESKIRKFWDDEHAAYPEKMQRELEIITGKLMPLAIDILKPTAESYSLLEVDPERGWDGWTYRPCDLICLPGTLESGESVPAEIQVKIEEFNDLLRETERHIKDIKDAEFMKSGLEAAKSGAMSCDQCMQKKATCQSPSVDSANAEQTDDSITPPSQPNPETTVTISKHPDPTPHPDREKERVKSRKTITQDNPQCAAERRKAVRAYIDEVFERTGKRLTRADIWNAARYKTRTDFERWQRNDPKATRSANERFTRLLREKPHLKK